MMIFALILFVPAKSSYDDFFQKLNKSVYLKIDLWLYFSIDFNNFFKIKGYFKTIPIMVYLCLNYLFFVMKN